jgi:hypothetical protein
MMVTDGADRTADAPAREGLLSEILAWRHYGQAAGRMMLETGRGIPEAIIRSAFPTPRQQARILNLLALAKSLEGFGDKYRPVVDFIYQYVADACALSAALRGEARRQALQASVGVFWPGHWHRRRGRRRNDDYDD